MREVDEVDAVGERLGELVPDLEREPRLADASCAGQRHQPRRRSAAAPPARRARRRGRRAASPAPAGAVASARSDGSTASAGSCRRIACCSSCSSGPGSRPSSSRIAWRARRNASSAACLPIAPVEGEHQLPAEPLAASVLRDQRLELGNKIAMAAERQVGVDPVLERGQPQLLQPGRLGLRERFVANVLVRRAAPQLERLAKARRRRVGVPLLQLRPAARRQQLESFEIQLAGLEAQSIPGPLARDPLWAQGAGAARARAPGGRSQRWRAAAHPRARRSAGRATRPRCRRSAGGRGARSAARTPGPPHPVRRRPARGPVCGSPFVCRLAYPSSPDARILQPRPSHRP